MAVSAPATLGGPRDAETNKPVNQFASVVKADPDLWQPQMAKFIPDGMGSPFWPAGSWPSYTLGSQNASLGFGEQRNPLGLDSECFRSVQGLQIATTSRMETFPAAHDGNQMFHCSSGIFPPGGNGLPLSAMLPRPDFASYIRLSPLTAQPWPSGKKFGMALPPLRAILKSPQRDFLLPVPH